jgi:FAD/FMN-containing dehydrogenase
MSAIPPTGDDHVCGIEFSPLLEGAEYSRDHFQRFKNAIYDVGLDLGGSCYRFGGVMKPYLRRIFGDDLVNRHRAMKRQLDPAFVLNPDVLFDEPEAG